jgi:hypothetical protein
VIEYRIARVCALFGICSGFDKESTQIWEVCLTNLDQSGLSNEVRILASYHVRKSFSRRKMEELGVLKSMKLGTTSP